MNIYFISPQNIRPFDFKFIIAVLKVKKVFSFIPSHVLDKEILVALDSLDTKYCPSPSKQLDFYKSCVCSICSKIAKTNKGDNSFQYEDMNLYEDSVNFSPKNNLLRTSDENVLILAFCKTSMSDTGIIWTPQFHFDAIHEDSTRKDISREISNFSCNLLRKRLGHTKYNNRICFFKLDEYLMKGFYYNATRNKWIEYWSVNRGKRKPFMNFISSLLYKTYPEIFTVSQYAEIKRFDKPYPTLEALKEYKNLLKEAEYRQEAYEKENEEEDNYPIDGFLEAYGDTLSEEEYENYIQERNDLY